VLYTQAAVLSLGPVMRKAIASLSNDSDVSASGPFVCLDLSVCAFSVVGVGDGHGIRFSFSSSSSSSASLSSFPSFSPSRPLYPLPPSFHARASMSLIILVSLPAHAPCPMPHVPSDLRIIESWLQATFEAVYAAPIDELSLRYRDEDYFAPGHNCIIGDCHRHLGTLIGQVVAQLPRGTVQCHTTVTAIRTHASTTEAVSRWAVDTRHQDGSSRTIVADHVVLTVPVGALASGALHFDPPLPPLVQVWTGCCYSADAPMTVMGVGVWRWVVFLAIMASGRPIIDPV
jgi:hypothetical protein